ncbi:MAG: amidase [Deltaproteobacteria bacterium]|jgi:Asp-tRNA(Asn)/Glu-tRNA(Gln) amidotransferase A subunit family amidase|nr:amidase [Deltaproteobacteria bacterium]
MMGRIPETWHEQKKMIARGKLRPIDLVDRYLGKIRAHNPTIRALTDILQQSAESAAAALGETYRDLPLAGLCLVVKDMIDVTPARCSGGLDYLKGRTPVADADIVARLRTAGAVVVAVSASDAGGFGVRTPQVTHPLSPERIVGGSSGGSAAAVAAGFAPVALGTDSGGSVRIPAACCNINGFKPSAGRVGTRGILPFSPTVDHVGFLSRSVDDIQIVMPVADPLFPETDLPQEGPLRIGFAPDYADDGAPEIQTALRRFRQELESGGIKIRHVSLPHPPEIAVVHDRIVAVEAAAAHATLRYTAPEDLPGVVRKTLAYAATVSHQQYLSACAQKEKLTGQLQQVFRAADFLVVPTLPSLPPRTSDRYIRLAGNRCHLDESLRRYTFLFNLTGNPVISLPLGSFFKKSAGVSVQLVGPIHGDARLLRFASHLEKQFQLVEPY